MTRFIYLLICLVQFAFGQQLFTIKTGEISFFAGTLLEDIDAKNSKSLSFVNLKSGDVLISIPNKDFVFKRSLMQEHFNENYMETEKYPKSTFKGTILNIDSLNIQSGEERKIAVKGILTLHGVDQNKTIVATILAIKNGFVIESKFVIILEEFKIERPKIVWEKLAEKVDVKLKFEYEPYKK